MMNPGGRSSRFWTVAVGAMFGVVITGEAAAEERAPVACRSDAGCPAGQTCSEGVCIDSPWGSGTDAGVPAPPGFEAPPPAPAAPVATPARAPAPNITPPLPMLQGAGTTLTAPSMDLRAGAFTTMPGYSEAQALRIAGILIMVAGTITVEVGALFGLFGSYVPSLAVTASALAVNGLGAGLLTAGIWRLRRLIEETGTSERSLGLFIVSWIFMGATGLLNIWGIVGDAVLASGASTDESTAIVPLVLGLVTSTVALVLLPIDYTYTRRHLRQARPVSNGRGSRGASGLAVVPVMAPVTGGGIVGIAGCWGGRP